MTETFEKIFRASNRVWSAMYYDELIDHPDFQITFLKGANRLYFNCGHLFRNLETSLTPIEDYFNKKNGSPAIYLNPDADPSLETSLRANGYREIEEEIENWYTLDLSDPIAPPSEHPSRKIHIFSPDLKNPLFDHFLKINALVNEITPEMIQKLKEKLTQKSEVRFLCSLVTQGGTPASIGLMGFWDNNVFLSEAATLPSFQRQGIYSEMRRKCLFIANKEGAQKAIVNCDNHAFSNPTYKRLGFTLIGQRRFFLKERNS